MAGCSSTTTKHKPHLHWTGLPRLPASWLPAARSLSGAAPQAAGRLRKRIDASPRAGGARPTASPAPAQGNGSGCRACASRAPEEDGLALALAAAAAPSGPHLGALGCGPIRRDVGHQVVQEAAPRGVGRVCNAERRAELGRQGRTDRGCAQGTVLQAWPLAPGASGSRVSRVNGPPALVTSVTLGGAAASAGASSWPSCSEKKRQGEQLVR